MALCKKGFVLVAVALVVGRCSDLSFVSGFSASAAHEPHTHHHGCSHEHHHDHGHSHSHGHGHGHQEERLLATSKLPEELAEEEDMKLYGFEFHQHDHGRDHEHFGAPQLSVLGLWIHSLGCSLLKPLPMTRTEVAALLQCRGSHPRQLLIRWLYLGLEQCWGMLFFINYHMLLEEGTPTRMTTMKAIPIPIRMSIHIHIRILWTIFQ